MSSVPESRGERLAKRLDASRDNVGYPKWLVIARQIAIFVLGIWIISYSVTAQSKNIAYIITGLILLGTIPVEAVIRHYTTRQEQREDRGVRSSASPTSSPSSPGSPGSSLP